MLLWDGWVSVAVELCARHLEEARIEIQTPPEEIFVVSPPAFCSSCREHCPAFPYQSPFLSSCSLSHL